MSCSTGSEPRHVFFVRPSRPRRIVLLLVIGATAALWIAWFLSSDARPVAAPLATSVGGDAEAHVDSRAATTAFAAELDDARAPVQAMPTSECERSVAALLVLGRPASTRRLVEELRQLRTICGDAPLLAVLSQPERDIRFRGVVISEVFARDPSVEAVDAARRWIRGRLASSALDWAQDCGFIELLAKGVTADDRELLLSLLGDQDQRVALVACAVIPSLSQAERTRAVEIACARAHDVPGLTQEIVARVCSAAQQGIDVHATLVAEDPSRPLEVRRAAALGIARGSDWTAAASWATRWADVAVDDPSAGGMALEVVESLAHRLAHEHVLDGPRNRAHIGELIAAVCAMPSSAQVASTRCAALIERWK